jgi:hypothetical protein
MMKSERLDPAAVVVSTMLPPLAASVLAVTDVGTPVTVAVTDSPVWRPLGVAAVAVSAAVISMRTRAFGLAPTTVSEVAPLGPTATAIAVEGAAEAGVTDESSPKPKAATVTSATRLKVVFVDICFLSISQDQEFPELGFELIS